MTEGPFRPRSETPPPRAHAEPETPPPRPAPPSPPPGIASSATWILGIALVLVLAYITINTVTTPSAGSRGVDAGDPLPVFAAPLVLGGPDKDANVATEPRDGAPRACDVRGAAVLNICDLAARGPVVLAFLASRSDRCIREIDRLDRIRGRFPGVQFAAVAIRGEREDLERLIRRRRWTIPVAWDRDGAVANAYSVAVCPMVTFAERGGTVRSTLLGEAGEAELRRAIEALR